MSGYRSFFLLSSGLASGRQQWLEPPDGRPERRRFGNSSRFACVRGACRDRPRRPKSRETVCPGEKSPCRRLPLQRTEDGFSGCRHDICEVRWAWRRFQSIRRANLRPVRCRCRSTARSTQRHGGNGNVVCVGQRADHAGRPNRRALPIFRNRAGRDAELSKKRPRYNSRRPAQTANFCDRIREGSQLVRTKRQIVIGLTKRWPTRMYARRHGPPAAVAANEGRLL